MNIHDTINLVAGLLQFTAAGYALRLKRIFGMARAGWPLFFAFALLAILHLMQSAAIPDSDTQSSFKVESMYFLISLLLLTGMIHIEKNFNEHLRIEREEIQTRERLKATVKDTAACLTRAIDALQAEMDERKRLEAEVEAHVELLDTSRRTGAAESDHNREMLAHIRF